MASSNAATPAPAASGNGRQNEALTGSRDLNNPTLGRDQRLLSLDFLGELGDSFITLGAAICAAAAAENVVVLELALRSARSVLMDAIGEFKSLSSEDGGAQ